MNELSPDWLAIKERLDAGARSATLAQRLIDGLPARPQLLEIGTQDGALFRWLAPRIGRSQVWSLLAEDNALIADTYAAIADWAERQGWKISVPGRAMLVHAAGLGTWRLEGFVAPLADVADLPDGIDAVAMDGVLSQMPPDWVDELALGLQVPLLACLNPVGALHIVPRDPGDAALRAALDHSPLRPLLSPDALVRIIEVAGCSVASAPSDWALTARGGGAGALAMLRGWVQFLATEAAMSRPAAMGPAGAWQSRRLKQGLAGRLAMRARHRDILVTPPEE
jgi:hypothetical protein